MLLRCFKRRIQYANILNVHVARTQVVFVFLCSSSSGSSCSGGGGTKVPILVTPVTTVAGSLYKIKK